MKTLLLILILTFTAFSQELPKDFSFNKQGGGESATYQVLPSEEQMLSAAEIGKAFQSIGIISQPDKDKFGLIFINAQTEFQFDKQAGKPFNLFVGDTKITGSSPTVFKKDKVKKLRVEMIVVQLSRADFERLVVAENVLIAYGNINYDVLPADLQAFRYIKTRIDSDVAARNPAVRPETPVYTGGDVHVNGYYRKDGTYVRPHTRSSPGRKH